MISRQAIIDAAGAVRGAEALSIARSYAPLKQDTDAWFLLATLEANCGTSAGLESALRQVLILAPDHRDANYNLGVLLQSRKQSVAAIGHYRIALKSGAYPQAQANLGLLMLEAGDGVGAIAMLEATVTSSPDLAEAQLNLGLAYIHASRYADAEQAFARVVAIDPANGKAQHSLGLCAESRGERARAEECYRQGIQHAPGFIDSYLRLGRLTALRGETQTSRAIYEAALRQDPRSVNALLVLGHLLSRMAANGGDYGEADACYARAMAINAKDARIHYAFGWIAQSKGDAAAAIKHYRTALTLQPDYHEAMAGLSSVLERDGNLLDARATIAPAMSHPEPHSLVLLADATLAKSQQERVMSAARLAARAPHEENAHWQCDLYFALGKLRDELADYDAAFTAYAAGNAIERVPFDHTANAAFFDRIIATYSRQAMPRLPRARNRSTAPVFIVGMPRSGTSLIEQILASHPQIFGAGELTAINYLMTHFDTESGDGKAFPEGATGARVAALSLVAEKHLAMLGKLDGHAVRITDKMPHNFICIGLIEQLFPGARIVHCTRDPIDTCLSIYFQHFNTHHPYANDLDALGRYYRQYEKLMQHWCAVTGLPMLEVRYEDVVADQEQVSRKLVDFCGVDWDDACLNFHATRRTVNTPSYQQVRKPIYQQSVARWKKYEAHLEPLLVALGVAH